jgi:hypothetical protein
MTTLPYFETEQLAAGFRACLNDALANERISVIEAQWLAQAQTEIPDSMTVHVVLNAQAWTAGALLLGYQDAERPWTYLYSPLHGLQVHESRSSALIAIYAPMRHLQIPTSALQLQSMQTAVFDQWSRSIIATQTDGLRRLDTQLQSIPSLHDALERSLQQSFKALLPDTPECHRHPLLIVDTQTDRAVATCTLRRAALASLCQEKSATGQARHFLDAHHVRLSTGHSGDWQQALDASVQALPATFQALLWAHWQKVPDDQDQSHLEYLALALIDDFTRALLRARQGGLIDAGQLGWLRQALLSSQTDAPQTGRLVYHQGAAFTPRAYAGLLVLRDPTAPQAPLYVYMPAAGLKRFRNENALQRFFLELTTQDARPRGLSQEAWQSLQSSPPLQVLVQPYPGPAFTDMAQSIVQTCAQDLQSVLQAPGAQSNTALANIEDTLDLRELLDSRLALLDNNERWQGSSPNMLTHLTHLTQPASHAVELDARARQVRALLTRLQELRSGEPDLHRCVESLLAPGLATVSEGRLQLSGIRLQHDGLVYSVADFFLVRVSGIGLDKPIQNVSVVDLQGKPLNWPDAIWLLESIDHLKTTFSSGYKHRIAQYEQGYLRVGKGLLDVREELAQIYEALLRADLVIARNEKVIDSALLELLQHALDRTQPSERVQLSLHLRIPADNSTAALTNTFALCAEQDLTGPVLDWTPMSGFQGFASMGHLHQAINHSLGNTVELLKWTQLAAPSRLISLLGQRTDPLDTRYQPSVFLQPFSGGLVERLCAGESIRRAQQRADELTTAIRCRFKPTLFKRFMSAREEPLAQALRCSLEELVNTRFNLHLPKWLQDASSEDLYIYQAMLERCAQLAIPELFYLYDVPEMEEYAHTLLASALAHDDAGYPTDPDQIRITLQHFSAGLTLPGQLPSSVPAATRTVTKSLTAFSLTHFSELSSSVMTVENMVPDKKVPDPAYLRALVARLDVATPYRKVLAQKLSPTAPDYAKRRAFFAMSLQANLMACTFNAQLEGDLSRYAALCMALVLTGPDALARERVNEVPVIFSQLHLQARPDLPPDAARGMYVVGPPGADSGPLVLYTAYQSDHFLQEFANEADLLRSLHADKRLQTLLLDRLDPGVRERYAHNGLLHPHILWSSSDVFGFSLDPAPARLSRTALTGNAFHHLFEESLSNLQYLAQTRTVTKAEADWKSFRYLMTLGLEQSSMFLPGKLAVLVNTWQSLDWIKAGASALKSRKWGEALAEFTTALSTLASSREPRVGEASFKEASKKPSVPEETNSTSSEPLPTPSSTLSNKVGETSIQRLLRRYEAQDVELRQMKLNADSQLFSLPGGDHTYAAIQGLVFEVRQFQERWYIVKDDQRGPPVRLRSDKIWEFYLTLRGGNEESVELIAERIDRDIPRIFTVQADGMPNVYRTCYLYYQQIHSARALALHLLSTALTNLNAARPWEPLPSKVSQILKATFGEEPDNQTLVRLRSECASLLNELLSPSMSPETSTRIVTGYNKPGSDYHLGFTYIGDPRKRIFLTELFFRIPDDLRMNTQARDSDLLAHHQASTLIHELSHLTLKTVDIAYVDAVMPNPAVLETETASNLAFYNRVKQRQEKGLSAATPAEELFTRQDSYQTRDISHKDGSAKSAVLRLTGAKDLAQARTLFLNDAQVRTNVILSNADSLTLLVMQLGHSASLGFDE